MTDTPATLTRTFEVRQMVRVRNGPGLGAAHVRWLVGGTRLNVDAASRTELDGYVWWQHEQGWSAERTIDSAQVYLLEILPTSGPLTFKVGDQQVRVRDGAGLGAAHVRWLSPGAEITVEASSRRETDGYVWWQHNQGWSAERTLDGRTVYLSRIVTAPTPAPVPPPVGDPDPAPGPAPTPDPTPPLMVRTFNVADRVRVRSAAGLHGAHVRWLQPGETITADATSRTEADGYVWWQHDEGWSAEKSLTDTSEVYLRDPADAEAEPPTPPPSGPILMVKQFHIAETVRVRSGPELSADHIRWLQPGETLDVDATSRTEANGYVWWRHADGWTAEKALDDSDVYLIDPATLPEPPAAPNLDDLPDEFVLQAGHQQVRVRSMPGLRGRHLKWLLPGEQITVRKASRTEADGYVWWQHADGWSAEKNLSGNEKYLYTPEEFADRPVPPGVTLFDDGLPVVDTLPMVNELFSKLPVPLEKTHWWQYYGNNVFAYNLWEKGLRWYSYAQGLHGGLDFGNSMEAVPVVAGVTGTFVKRDTRYTQPNGMWVRVGNYTIIYGHMASPPDFQPGDAITPDTVMGTLELGGQNHLHLEVRYKSTWIINPLNLMPEDMRNSLIAKFPPAPKYFYTSDTWNQWQTPLDQPVLRLGGDLIGPHA